ncbi:RNA polymerase II-associated rba50 [Gossypium arboreum]|uniref:RNA polymerase II-associated rba50 n=1 Tax=Gossypium arboreum TaxID=29729 RepID=A0A0B0PHN6_GOSAR|nr:RNA polymerase II-associated rba50 [Gossypium arboreum]
MVLQPNIDATVPDKVLHEIKYNANVPDMVLHVNHKSVPTSQMWSCTKTHIGSYVMTYVS